MTDKNAIDAIFEIGVKQGLTQALAIANELMADGGSAYDVFKAIKHEIERLYSEER